MSKFNKLYEQLMIEAQALDLKQLKIMIRTEAAKLVMSIVADYPHYTHNYLDTISGLNIRDGKALAQGLAQFVDKTLLPMYQKVIQAVQQKQDIQSMLNDKDLSECFKRRLSILIGNAQSDTQKLDASLKEDLKLLQQFKPDDLAQFAGSFNQTEEVK